MENLKRLPDSELRLMMIIWEAGEPVSSPYILEKLAGQKTWAKTTVLNFLSRLVDRGFLIAEKRGRFHYFSPVVAQETYLQMESCSFLERLHKNSLKSLVTSLYHGNGITNDDLQELRRYIEELEA